MKVKIISYVDNERLLEEIYEAEVSFGKMSDEISYTDKNNEKIKIIVDKIKESVSIEKDTSLFELKFWRTKTKHSTAYGTFDLESQLVSLEKKERNKLVYYEIVYNLFFNNEKQKNKLKILIKKED